jgi:hypothetical protein
MYELELARSIQADRERDMAESLRLHRMLKSNDSLDTEDQPVRAAEPARIVSPAPSAGTSSVRTASSSSRP